jgi:hypothetical protein
MFGTVFLSYNIVIGNVNYMDACSVLPVKILVVLVMGTSRLMFR